MEDWSGKGEECLNHKMASTSIVLRELHGHHPTQPLFKSYPTTMPGYFDPSSENSLKAYTVREKRILRPS